MVSDFRPRESYQFFLQEAVELLQSLEQGLLELRDDHSTQKIHNLMRTAHSIKGGAACVGLNHIKKIAHDLENAFKILYQDGIKIDFELEELLLQAYDRLKSPLMAEIHTGETDPEATIAKAQPVLQELQAKLKAQSSYKKITDFPFAREIDQGLDRLSLILSSPDETDILEALKVQFTIFRGLAEVSGVADFLTIADSTLEKLDKYPDSVITIGENALAQFRATYEAITKIQKTNFDSQSKEKTTSSLVLHSELSSSLSNKPEPEKVPEDIIDSQIIKSTLDKITTTTNHQNTDYKTFADYKSTRDQLIADGPQLPSLALGIRMDPSRLELLHNLVGELVTQDNRFLLQNQQNGETLASLSQWYNRFKQLSQNLKLWADRLPNDTWQSERVRKEVSPGNTSNTQHLKSSLQTILEELAQLGEGLQDLTFLEQSFEKIRKTRQKTVKKNSK